MEVSRSRRRTFAYPIAVATCGILPSFLAGALGPQIREDLGFDPLGLGIATSGFFVAQALVSAPVGRLVEGAGPRRAMRAAALGSAGSLACVAIFSDSWALLCLFLLLGGIANAASQLSASLFLTREISDQRQGLGFGLKEAAKPAATLLCGAAVPLVGATFGWQWAYAAFALVALGVGYAAPNPSKARPSAGPEDPDETLHLPPLVFLAAGAGLGSATITALGIFVVEAGVAYGLSFGLAGAALAAGSLLAVAVRVALGWAADHRPMDHLKIVAAMLAVGAIGFILLATEDAVLFAPGIVLAFGAGWGWLGLFNFAIVGRNPKTPTRALGVGLTGAATGSAAGPLLFGSLLSATSFGMAWTCVAACAVAAAASMLIGKHMPDRRSGDPTGQP